jgi:hypothetical protein
MVGIAARVAHGAIGSTSAPHKLSPTEPGGVLCVRSQVQILPGHSEALETGPLFPTDLLWRERNCEARA